MTRPDDRPGRRHQPRFYVLWCGSECAGNPHLTREVAEAWIEEQMEQCRLWRAGFYGHYRIEERSG